MLRNPLIPLVSWLLDAVLGDPPNRWHPVAWQGRFLAWAEEHAPGGRSQESGGSEITRFAWGAGALAIGMGLSAGAAWGVMRVARSLPWPLRLLIEAGLLKLTLASHGLDRAAGEVEAALRRGRPARSGLLSWHLVSRDTSDLSAEEVAWRGPRNRWPKTSPMRSSRRSGAHAAGGLPGVWAYRFAQTADGMRGYHDEKHEWLKRRAAR